MPVNQDKRGCHVGSFHSAAHPEGRKEGRKEGRSEGKKEEICGNVR